jgi:hypothetical protein
LIDILFFLYVYNFLIILSFIQRENKNTVITLFTFIINTIIKIININTKNELIF